MEAPRSDEGTLIGSEVGELRSLARRVLDYLSVNNHNDFEDIYPRFSKLLSQWREKSIK